MPLILPPGTTGRESLLFTRLTSCETCLNILCHLYLYYRKLSDGLFLKECEKISELYPNIEFNSMIIDNCCMQVMLVCVPLLIYAVMSKIDCTLSLFLSLTCSWCPIRGSLM